MVQKFSGQSWPVLAAAVTQKAVGVRIDMATGLNHFAIYCVSREFTMHVIKVGCIESLQIVMPTARNVHLALCYFLAS